MLSTHIRWPAGGYPTATTLLATEAPYDSLMSRYVRQPEQSSSTQLRSGDSIEATDPINYPRFQPFSAEHSRPPLVRTFTSAPEVALHLIVGLEISFRHFKMRCLFTLSGLPPRGLTRPGFSLVSKSRGGQPGSGLVQLRCLYTVQRNIPGAPREFFFLLA
jgi:hypothetical protein